MTGWMFLDLWAICGYLGTFTDDIPMSVFFWVECYGRLSFDHELELFFPFIYLRYLHHVCA